MQADLIQTLNKEGIHEYGSAELKKFEQQLTKYFAREYALNNGNDQAVELGHGPIALAADDLADHHYDEGLEFFKAFLDRETMSYTMAFFDDDPDKISTSDKSLDQAQTDKLRLIAQRMQLTGNEKLLNIGCGFGYFESFLLNEYPDLRITSTTHSRDQYDFLHQRQKSADDILSSDRFTLLYTKIDDNTASIVGTEKFDAACSMGLMEQINNVELFFNLVSTLLVKNGRMFHHLIVSRDLIPQFLDPQKTLIGDYFPGGKVLPYYALRRDFEHFTFQDSWFLNGMNYWMTLDKWHRNFWHNLDRIYPALMNSKRVEYWNNYFVLCKAMFYPENGAAYGNGQYLFVRK